MRAKIEGVTLLSLTALMEPPMFGVNEPLTGADFRVSDSVIVSWIIVLLQWSISWAPAVVAERDSFRLRG